MNQEEFDKKILEFHEQQFRKGARKSEKDILAEDILNSPRFAAMIFLMALSMKAKRMVQSVKNRGKVK